MHQDSRSPLLVQVQQGLWPLSAVLVWGSCWLAHVLLIQAGGLTSLLLPSLLGLAAAMLHQRPWRRLIVALGFPLSLWLHVGLQSALVHWVWAVLLLILLLMYPRRSWVDAPMYPTPRGALQVLPEWVNLSPDAMLLDAGSGMGHGLVALQQAFPQHRVVGVEWSRLLCWVARWRCPSARILCADMWAHDWRPYQLVYMFQRPESMARALAKAQAELRPGACLASLDFELPGRKPLKRVALGGRHRLFLYRF